VTISSATIDSNNAAITGGTVSIAKGTSGTVVVTIPSTGSSTTEPFANTAQYTITLMTAKGNKVTTQATYTGT